MFSTHRLNYIVHVGNSNIKNIYIFFDPHLVESMNSEPMDTKGHHILFVGKSYESLELGLSFY